jgi:hypothetical protein
VSVFIKAFFLYFAMMVNLPCLMGSYPNFLRPTCSYTECRLSFQTGSCPTEYIPASYSSCFVIDLTDHTSFRQGTGIQWTLALLSYPLVLLLMQCDSTPSLSGSFPEPCPDPDLSESRQGSGMMMFFFVMLQVPVFFPFSGYLPPSFADHTLFHFSG